MDSSLKKPRLRFWKYNPDTKTLYFVSETNKGKMQYPIGARNFDGYSKSQIATELRSRLSRYGVIHDDQLNKAILSIGDTVVEHSDIIDVSGDEFIEHRLNRTEFQHPGYYTPNLRPTVVYKWHTASLKEDPSGRLNPTVWFDFAENVPIHEGDVFVTTSFVSDPRMINDDNLLRNRIRGAVEQMAKTAKNGKLPYTIPDSELMHCTRSIQRLLKQYQQSHPNFVNKLTHSIGTYSIGTYYVVDSDYLEHHGILGMHWGVRRFQNKNGSLTPAGRDRYLKGGKNSESKSEESGLKVDESSDDKYGISPLVLPFAVWGAELAIFLGIGAASAAKEGIREAKAEKKLFAEDKQYGLKKEDLKKCNPNFGKDGYNNNCPKCSTVMELRKRGMDVQANSGSGQTMEEMCSWFKNCKYESDLHVSKAKEKILSYPPGSSGFVSGHYKSFGGHVVHWTNIDGEIRVEDGQSGKVYTWDQAVQRYNWQEDRYSVARLDNCAINEKAMNKASVFVEYKEGDKKK